MTRLSLRIDFGADRRLGPGKIRLLELIGEQGSISAAARGMAMSYKRAWTLVETLNTMFETPLVSAQVGGTGGGKAALTPLGTKIVQAYRGIEAQAAAAAAKALASMEAHLAAS